MITLLTNSPKIFYTWAFEKIKYLQNTNNYKNKKAKQKESWKQETRIWTLHQMLQQ